MQLTRAPRDRASLPIAVVLLVIVALFSLAARAQAPCDNRGLVMMYFNGFDNTFVDGYAALHVLRRAHGDKEPNGAPLEYKLMFNASHGVAADFLESMRQRQQELGLPDIAVATVYFGFYAITFSAYYEHANEYWNLRLREAVAAPHQEAAIVASFVADASNLLTDNYRLLFVAHSQGNLFARDVYNELLKSRPNLGDLVNVVNVATPSSTTTTGSNVWVTAFEDTVISKVPGALPATYGLLEPDACKWLDPRAHNFISIYQNSFCVGDTVSLFLLTARRRLEPPLIPISPSCTCESSVVWPPTDGNPAVRLKPCATLVKGQLKPLSEIYDLYLGAAEQGYINMLGNSYYPSQNPTIIGTGPYFAPPADYWGGCFTGFGLDEKYLLCGSTQFQGQLWTSISIGVPPNFEGSSVNFISKWAFYIPIPGVPTDARIVDFFISPSIPVLPPS